MDIKPMEYVGVQSRYFDVSIDQAFVAGTQYTFSLADFGMSDITPKGFAWRDVKGNTNVEEANMPRSNGTTIQYTPSVNNSSFVTFHGVVFY